MTYDQQGPGRPLLLTDVRPMGFGPDTPEGRQDILIDRDGAVRAVGRDLPRDGDAELVDGKGAFVSPGWVDLHVHVWHGGTDISIRPRQCGLERGVVTLADAGSAGEASFHGFREYVIERSPERILAFLNIGSIGLVACNRVSELIDIRSIDVDRTLACVEANRDVIRGIKVRASHVILGSWGITPVKVAKKVARITKLPLMVHVGEPPPHRHPLLQRQARRQHPRRRAGLEPGRELRRAWRGLGRGPRRRFLLVQDRRDRDQARASAAHHLDRPAPALPRPPGLGLGHHHGEADGGGHAP
jgi:predicted amidohydrolase